MHQKIITLQVIILCLCLIPNTFAIQSENFNVDLSEMTLGGGVSSSENYHINATLDSNTAFEQQSSPDYHLESGLIELEQFCGNAIVEWGEQCDDGNTNNEDTCSNSCQKQNKNSGGGGGGGSNESNSTNAVVEKVGTTEIKKESETEQKTVLAKDCLENCNNQTLAFNLFSEVKNKTQNTIFNPKIAEGRLIFNPLFSTPKDSETLINSNLDNKKKDQKSPLKISCIGLNQDIRYSKVEIKMSEIDFLDLKRVIKLNNTTGAIENYDFSADEKRDSDHDRIPDNEECLAKMEICLDSDGDGLPNFLDKDSDNDGIPDIVEGEFTDMDLDKIPDYVDASINFSNSGDSDNDGIPDHKECPNGFPCLISDKNSTPDYLNKDINKNGIEDGLEYSDEFNYNDVDGDLIPNYLDKTTDSDGDGLHDMDECPAGAPCMDSDRDTKPDYLDEDSDGDGWPDSEECPTGLRCLDENKNGIIDILDSYNKKIKTEKKGIANITQSKPFFISNEEFLIPEGLIVLKKCEFIS